MTTTEHEPIRTGEDLNRDLRKRLERFDDTLKKWEESIGELGSLTSRLKGAHADAEGPATR